jgi:hypothetical protein
LEISFNSKKKLSQKQSNRILRSFQSLLKVGNSLPSAIDVLSQVEKGNNKKILEKVHYGITHLDLSIGKALEKEGIIKDNEVLLIDRSTSAIDAIASILSVRELSGNFEKTVLKLFAFPLLAFIIGLIIAYAAQPTFHDMVYSLVEQVKFAKGLDVSDEASLMWYLEDRYITSLLLKIYLIVLITLIGLYIYYLEYKPEVIYKILPLKAYDDVPYILMLIYNLQKIGLDQVRIFQMLKASSPRKGWIKLFDSLEREATTGKYIFTVFEKYSFPKDVTLVLKSAEVSKTFWDNMPILVNYVQEANKAKHAFITGTFGGLSSIFGFLIILYFVAGLFMAMFSLQNLAMAMM